MKVVSSDFYGDAVRRQLFGAETCGGSIGELRKLGAELLHAVDIHFEGRLGAHLFFFVVGYHRSMIDAGCASPNACGVSAENRRKLGVARKPQVAKRANRAHFELDLCFRSDAEQFSDRKRVKG